MGKYEHPADPRGLIYEAYRMDIGHEDCRTIFFDWAIGQPGDVDTEQIRGLLAHYGSAAPDHAMTSVLREGLEKATRKPLRKGGWRGRRAR